jgi:hypothetical protein
MCGVTCLNPARWLSQMSGLGGLVVSRATQTRRYFSSSILIHVQLPGWYETIV